MSDDLVTRLNEGHDRECAMSYGMHEHCCDCSFPIRQDAAAEIARLWAERDALMGKAADEIERLREELDTLRARVTDTLTDADRRVVGTLREWK